MSNLPKTLNECVTILYKMVSEKDREIIGRSDVASFDNSHLGATLRKEWCLWLTTSNLSRWFQHELGIGHPDDLSATILAALWAKIRGEPFIAWNYVRPIKSRWYAVGLDPIGQGPMTYARMCEVQKEIQL